ncbi:hypothetical protein EVAR_27899_1 [Eumeta japonica]|uniref:Uncharacterized protein n=1 Tax=Eumeta variegata TaxID=151549 RepID=A0A4C1UW89_EUMVA|nr:hypothetical protein EVAR_27899_1 [Eumeta japonica]
MKYPIPTQEAGISLMTPLALQVFVGRDDYLLSDDSQTCLPLENAIKKQKLSAADDHRHKHDDPVLNQRLNIISVMRIEYFNLDFIMCDPFEYFSRHKILVHHGVTLYYGTDGRTAFICTGCENSEFVCQPAQLCNPWVFRGCLRFKFVVSIELLLPA